MNFKLLEKNNGLAEFLVELKFQAKTGECTVEKSTPAFRFGLSVVNALHTCGHPVDGLNTFYADAVCELAMRPIFKAYCRNLDIQGAKTKEQILSSKHLAIENCANAASYLLYCEDPGLLNNTVAYAMELINVNSMMDTKVHTWEAIEKRA